MDARHAVDLLDAAPGLLVHPVTRSVPVGAALSNILF